MAIQNQAGRSCKGKSMAIQNRLPAYILLSTLLLLPLNTQVFFMTLPKALGMPGMLLSSWKEGMFALMGLLIVAELLLGSPMTLTQRPVNLSLTHISGFFLFSIFWSFSSCQAIKASRFSASGLLPSR